MSTLTIRGLDDKLHQLLRVRAAHHGRSMEAEARAILKESLRPAPARSRLGSRIHARVADVGGVELETPTRDDSPRGAEFDE